MFAQEYWNYAKFISSVLRFGMPIPDVVNLISSLHLNVASINTWKNGVDRALKKYIPDGTVVTKRNKCPDCGNEGTLMYKEGCLTCADCGYSKCG
jgi:ribonucleoside-diphosphate reductase alpha chain